MKRSDKGIVLLTVIIFVILLAALSTAILSVVLSQFKLAKHRENREITYYYVVAGLKRAHWEYSRDNTWDDTYNSYENAQDFEFPPDSGNIVKIWADPDSDCQGNPSPNQPCLHAKAGY